MLNYRYLLLEVIVLQIVLVFGLVGQTKSDGLYIGWASADITPSDPVIVAGGSSARVFDDVNDPITSTVLVIESVNKGESEDFVIMISVDLVASSEFLKKRIVDKVKKSHPKVGISKVIMNATHSHAAPATRISPERQKLMSKYGIDLPLEWATYGVNMEGFVMSPLEYIELASERISKAIIEAWDGRELGGISFGVSNALVGQNRLTSYFDGHSEMYGRTDDFEFSHLEGYEDHSINLLYTWDDKSNLTGILINVAVPAQAEYGPKLSADYWHETRVTIENKLGENIYLFPQISAAGDISPKILVDHRAESRMLKLNGRTQREQIGINIGNAVMNILPIMRKNIEWNPDFKHKSKNLELSRRRITHDDIYEAKGTWHKPEVETVPQTIDRLLRDYKKMSKELEENPELKKQENWYGPISATYWRLFRAIELLEKYNLERTDPTITCEVHAIRIGDMAIITNPFELYIDFGMQLKARSEAVQTFVVQLVGEGTYVPTHRAVYGGTYGAIPQSNTIGPEGGRQLVNQSLDLIKSLWSQKELEEQVSAN